MNRSSNTLLILIILLSFSNSVIAQKTFYSDKIKNWEIETPSKNVEKNFSIFLIGDLKYPNDDNKVLQLLEKQMSMEGAKSSVIVLGDIVYPVGLPDSSHKEFEESLVKHKYVLSKFKNYQGQIYFIPGNHDWNKGKRNGWQHILNQENYIEKALNRGNSYLPDGGTPGPVEVSLNDEIVLIIFDYQWFLHKYDKTGIAESGFEKADDFFVQFEDMIQRNAHKKVIIANHFPLFSVGNHGGYFPFKSSFFPLTEKVDWLYLPLPGFIYTGYRKIFGHIQDIPHPKYRGLRNKIWDIITRYPNTIYAAGHEHNLQYFNKGGIHHIISGGGGEGTYISKRKNKADFAAASEGFCRLDFYKNGDVWVEYLKPTNNAFRSLFRKKLFNKKREHNKLNTQNYDFKLADSSIKTKLELFKAGRFKKFFLGENYRQDWNTVVEFPIFDIGREQGGLSIIKRGGGMQTFSLRLKNKKGKQFVLRSVNKEVKKSLQVVMHNTLVEDIVKDGISASLPYSPLTIPTMADAAGVYHTNPKLVYVPDDPRFGIYQKYVANKVFLFEERPAGNREEVESFGNSKKIISTFDLIKKLKSKSSHRIDQKAVLRARLFDILINDWDRHEDQWRWASFKEKGKTIYRPIPRDRDWAYYVNQGVITWVLSRNFLMPKFQGFDYKLKNVVGLSSSAIHFDRSFLNAMTKEDWINEAKKMQVNVTDDIIEIAIKKLPPEIYAIRGLEIEQKLKERIKHLPEYAAEYADFLYKKVDVVGSNDRDYFKIDRKENGDMQVKVYNLSEKKGKIKDLKYDRLFKFDETKEVRLYGLKDKDRFDISGKADKGIKLRVIGGKGKDKFNDDSEVSGPSRKNIIYDRRDKKNKFNTGKETNLQLGTKKSINKYNRTQFTHNKNFPIAYLGYNIDDGLFIGGGIYMKHYNFRDSTIQRISTRYAHKTSAFGFEYKGLFTSVSRHFDLSINADLGIPRNVDNFFGLGNETELVDFKRDSHEGPQNEAEESLLDELDDIEESYYRIKYKNILFNPMFEFNRNRSLSFGIGPLFEYIHITDTADRYISTLYAQKIGENAFKHNSYFGIRAKIDIDTRNNKLNPERGIQWINEALYYADLNGRNNSYLKLKTDLSMYVSFKTNPNYVFAFRFGGALNVGDYDFYYANFLGGKNNLRGYFSNRFAGDSYLYQNTELRLKLLNIRKYLFVGQWGLLFYNDFGRVWLKGEESDKWHHGYGIGTWLNPFNATILNVTYQISEEEKFLIFKLSFLF